MIVLSSCKNEIDLNTSKGNEWDVTKLKEKAMENIDSRQWNKTLFEQDIETYAKYAETFKSYPLNNYPFPVADYDYAVYSNPFTIRLDSLIFKGIQIGEYEGPDSDKVSTKLTLIVLANDDNVEPETFVNSRNFPYLTAEGSFQIAEQNYQWVFQATPDGFSSLFFSMKLFDLRFGETIIIYPQEDNSFLYVQVDESPDNFTNFDDFITKIEIRF